MGVITLNPRLELTNAWLWRTSARVGCRIGALGEGHIRKGLMLAVVTRAVLLRSPNS